MRADECRLSTWAAHQLSGGRITAGQLVRITDLRESDPGNHTRCVKAETGQRVDRRLDLTLNSRNLELRSNPKLSSTLLGYPDTSQDPLEVACAVRESE